MYKDNAICAVIPAYNEAGQIGKVIETMPDYIDHMVVVDDASRDETVEVVRNYQKDNHKIILLEHEANQGVGGAIATGYKWARDNGMDIAVVMAGDGQMDPRDLPALLDPVVEEGVDYTKGNRLFTGEAYSKIPKVRYYGNAFLSLLTKMSSGYWHVADSQSGYTAINAKALHTINWDKMYKRYGQPNDLLIRLNQYDFRVRDVQTRPVYNVGETSGIKLYRVVPKIVWILFRGFWQRFFFKYVIRDFHPLIFFYLLSFFLLILCVPLTVRMFSVCAVSGDIPDIHAMVLAFSIIS
ncbi:MAG: glycosyltransferase family 2 protein, partial [Deltaproteobacteria bacterium]|nr:glycosyltransferase family 2 protein [Deltaproteobacteria bacterium]